MYCGPDKNRFMTLDQYRKIIDDCQTDFEVQLEGGEPFKHRDIERFIEYAISQERCRKVIILTNGNMLIYMRKFERLANRYDTKIEFKVSMNYFLISEAMKHGSNKEQMINSQVALVDGYLLSRYSAFNVYIYE